MKDSKPFNAQPLYNKSLRFHYDLERNGYQSCLEDLEKAGVIEYNKKNRK